MSKEMKMESDKRWARKDVKHSMLNKSDVENMVVGVDYVWCKDIKSNFNEIKMNEERYK